MLSIMEGFEEFEIDEYGGFGRKPSPFLSTEEEGESKKCNIVIREDGFFEKISKYDFIQDTARAGSVELNFLINMCMDLIVLGCHKNRVPNGTVEKTLERIRSEWKEMCLQCDRLKIFSEERHKAKVREDARRKKKREQAKAHKLNRIYKKDDTGPALTEAEYTQEKQDRKKYLCHGGYGSSLLQATRVSPTALYEDTKNIRRALIWCLMCLSEDVQRLVRCGKFYSDTYKCHLRYAPIQADALDEFVHLIDPLKNAFYTCQMSAANFVLCMQSMVEKKGVDHFVKVILAAARTLETLRIAKAHMIELNERETHGQ
jgi:hypothetical protein